MSKTLDYVRTITMYLPSVEHLMSGIPFISTDKVETIYDVGLARALTIRNYSGEMSY